MGKLMQFVKPFDDGVQLNCCEMRTVSDGTSHIAKQQRTDCWSGDHQTGGCEDSNGKTWPRSPYQRLLAVALFGIIGLFFAISYLSTLLRPAAPAH